MTLANAFTAAWKDLKAVASKVATVLTQDSAAIQTVVTDASTVVAGVAPSLAPAVTEFDVLEEAIMGKIAAAAADVANASSLSALFGEIWPGVQSLVATLKNHPTVASVTAALGAAQKAN
jgi:phage-related protein